MPEPKIIITSKTGSPLQLPGTLTLPDAKKPVPMGSGVITSLISSGGMAIIYEIWNAELEVKRAIKLLHPDHTRESEERFQTEMKITAKLHHPNIIEIYAVGKWNDLPYIEMERIDGVTLEKLIADSGGLPVEVCTAIGIMTGRALNYSHNQDYQLYGKEYHGIIHRDLKPGNIMVTNTGIVKLMDFGIAKPVTVSMHTMEGVIMGTMQYLAPEQLDGKDIDVRADIYSLGAVMYEMLTGSRAFPEQNLAKLVTDKLNNNYIPLSGYSRKIPSPLCALVEKCLRYEKEKRVQNALEFLRTLGNVHKSIDAQSPEQILSRYMKEAHHGKTLISIRKKPHRAPIMTGALILLSLICIAILGFGLYRYEKSGKKPLTAKLPMPAATQAPVAEKPKQAPQPVALIDTQPAAKPPLAADREIKDVFAAPSHSTESALNRHRTSKGKDLNDAPVPRTKKHPSPVSQAPVNQHVSTEPDTAAMINSARTDNSLKPPDGAPEIKRAERKNSLLNKLKQQFRTSDVMTIFTGEVENGHFQNALSLYAQLSEDDAETKKARIYRLRALKGTNDGPGLGAMLAQDIYDGEFYLEKARYYFDRREVARAQEMLKKAAISPCGFMDAKLFRQFLLYSIALCASAVYDDQLSEETKKKAMEAWYDVKSLFRTSPDHEYFKKADSEIRRISKNAVATR
jgi:serine/threonine-protein kinase